MSHSSLVWKSFSMARNKCCVICVLLFWPPWTTPMELSRYNSTCTISAAHACRERAPQAVLSFFVWPHHPLLCQGGVVAVRASTGWGGELFRWGSVVRTLSLANSISVQNKAADLTYPIGMDRWNLTCCSSLGGGSRGRKAMERMSYRQTHMRIYASDISTLLRKSGISFGSTTRMQSSSL